MAYEESLYSAVGIEDAEVVALIGGGGKTTTMMALSDELTADGKRVAITTTTKIWPPRGFPLILGRRHDVLVDEARRALGQSKKVVIAREIGPEGKLYGVDSQAPCHFGPAALVDVVLVEADGAAGRSLKAHGAGEPVVPLCAGRLIVICGLDAIGQPVDDRWVHRVDRFCAIAGVRRGDVILAEHIVRALLAAADHAPPSARVTYLLNKADCCKNVNVATHIKSELQRLDPAAPVVLAAYGGPVAAYESVSGSASVPS